MTAEIATQIQTLIDKTRENKIDWQQVGANAFRWIRTLSDGQTYNVTVQSNPIMITTMPPIQGGVPQVKQMVQYSLTIQSKAGGMLILQLQAHLQLNPDYYSLLKQLSDVITERSAIKSSSILNKLLENL